MHIDIVPSRGAPPAVLLRESFREDGKVRKRTLANLSSLSGAQVEAMRQVLKGRSMVPADQLFEQVESYHHGHVQAVRMAMQRLGFTNLLASRSSPERDRVCAMVASQILEPASKLAFTRWWQNTTIPQLFGVGSTGEDELYAAMDWLLERQPSIEKKLAARHLKEGGLVLYDLSSSYFEGVTCPLAALGHNRDGKKGKLQVNYGLLTDSCGCPVAVSVFKGNSGDPKTLMPQVEKTKKEFGIQRLVLVGDSGMTTQVQIKEMRKREDHDGIDWITALKSGAIRKLIDGKKLQMGLFDERNLFELTSPDFPGERLIACRNLELGKLRGHKRQSMLAATEKELEQVRRMIANRKIAGRDSIGVRVGKVINKFKMAKHYKLQIGEKSLEWTRQEDKVAAEAALDGIYVVRTSLEKAEMGAEDTVRSYKQLSVVERAFRSLKSIDLDVRPIRHHVENRVRAHIFTTLVQRMSAIVRNVCHPPGAKAGATFEIVTTPDHTQQRALDLLETITV